MEVTGDMDVTGSGTQPGGEADGAIAAGCEGPAAAGNCCCPYYHEAIELVGRRWSGAIVRVLMEGPMRFSEIVQAVPELSDRLLSARMKELEARGIVEREVYAGPPLRVEYSLSEMGRELEPALTELEQWARRWLGSRAAAVAES